MSKQVAEAIVYLADAIKETFGTNPLVVRTAHDEIQKGTDLLETVDKIIEHTSNREVTLTALEQFKQEPPESDEDEDESETEEVSPAKQKEAVRNALAALQDATDVPTAKALLNSFGDATSIGKLKVEDYPDVIKACKKPCKTHNAET